MAVIVGSNGFGRIGRDILRAGYKNGQIEFVAVNDLPVPAKVLAHLLKYDSILGILDAKIEAKENSILVNGKELKIVNFRYFLISKRVSSYKCVRSGKTVFETNPITGNAGLSASSVSIVSS